MKILAFLIISFTTMYSQTYESMIGMWSSEAGTVKEMTLIFKEGKKVIWRVMGGGKHRDASGSVSIDFSKTPHHIDITNLDVPQMKDVTVKGIFEYVDDDNIKIFMIPMQTAHSKRPQNFDQYYRILNRVGSNNKTKSETPSIGTTGIYGHDGMIIINNVGPFAFMFNVKGEKFNPIKADYFMMSIDQNVLIMNVLPIDLFTKEKVDVKKIIDDHIKYESQYIENMLKKKLDLKISYDKINGYSYAIWSFKAPKIEDAQSTNSAVAQHYISFYNKSHIILMNSPDMEYKDAKSGKKLLLNLIQNMRISDKLYDFSDISGQIQNGKTYKTLKLD